jgi:hypothetical protein
MESPAPYNAKPPSDQDLHTLLSTAACLDISLDAIKLSTNLLNSSPAGIDALSSLLASLELAKELDPDSQHALITIFCGTLYGSFPTSGRSILRAALTEARRPATAVIPSSPSAA